MAIAKRFFSPPDISAPAGNLRTFCKPSSSITESIYEKDIKKEEVKIRLIITR